MDIAAVAPPGYSERLDKVNDELLDSLLAALSFSPDNTLLRKQVLQGLVDAQRWSQVDSYAQPLLGTEHSAIALMAMSRAAYALGDSQRASDLYEDAISEDPRLVDEQFEAALAPQIRLPIDGPAFEESSRFLPYAGPRITFTDVGGMETLKEQIRLTIIYPFQKPEIYAAYGKKTGGGLLMYGPPGCGKTHIARATAGEIGANFYMLELSDVLSMWIGETEKNLNQLFETARSNCPAVIFIDEVDSIGAKRSDINSTSIRWFVSQLLTEMDGIASRNDDLLVLGATNAPWDVDPALRRPGRFDRVLFVPPPDAGARMDIMKLHAHDRKIDPQLSWQQIAEKAELFSGADLASLIDRACEGALSDALKFGKMRDVGAADFLRVLKQMRPSTVEWLRRAKNYVTYANQDGFYDDLAQFIAQVKL